MAIPEECSWILTALSDVQSHIGVSCHMVGTWHWPRTRALGRNLTLGHNREVSYSRNFYPRVECSVNLTLVKVNFSQPMLSMDSHASQDPAPPRVEFSE